MIVIGQHSFCEGVEENGSFRNLADGIWEPSFLLFSNSLWNCIAGDTRKV